MQALEIQFDYQECLNVLDGCNPAKPASAIRPDKDGDVEIVL